MDRLNVMEENWDYLIILDACRYDYFQRSYGNYLQGRLEKKISIGSSTNEWRDKSFPGRYDDVEYITANPQINATSKVYGFCAGDHFHKVHEVWKDGWVRGTVPPETLTAAAIDIVRNTTGKRMIIHYIQPHAPYLSLGDDARGYENADINTPRTLVGEQDRKKTSAAKKLLFKIGMSMFRSNSILGNHPDWALRKFLQITPMAPMEIVLRNYTVDQLRAAYSKNLELVLEQTVILLQHLTGRIVITADHGELLGEDKSFSHPTFSSHPILLEVPWMVIEKEASDIDEIAKQEPVKGSPQTQTDADKEREEKELAEKLKSLGYY